MNKILIGLYYLIVILLLAIILISLWFLFFGETHLPIGEVKIQSGVFGLIIAGITIILASSIILPKFLIEQAVQEEISKRGASIEKKIEKEYGTHINTTDAHISRMIAYLLSNDNILKEYGLNGEKSSDYSDANILHGYSWTAGWAFRSFKNYLRISNKDNVIGESVRPKNYHDLIKITENIVQRSKDKIFEYTGYNKIEDINKDSIYTIANKFEGETIEDNWTSVHRRSIKEILDIEYMYNKNKLKLEKEMRIQTGDFLSTSTPLILFSIFVIISYSHKDNPSFKINNMAEEIINISNYKSEEEYSEYVNKLYSTSLEMLTRDNEGEISSKELSSFDSLNEFSNKQSSSAS